MRNFKHYIFIFSFGLLSNLALVEENNSEEEAAQPSNPQELLEIVKQGQFADIKPGKYDTLAIKHNLETKKIDKPSY